MTNHARNTSQPPQTLGTNTQTSNSSNLTPLDTNTINKCIRVTDSFRQGERTKVEAFLALQDIFNDVQLNEMVILTSLEHYLKILDNYERDKDAVAETGQRI